MPSALSVDLRERVVAAIEAGASRRQTAQRFGVGIASAVRWHASFRQEGRIAPKPMGGDQRSQAIEAQAERVVALYEERHVEATRAKEASDLLIRHWRDGTTLVALPEPLRPAESLGRSMVTSLCPW